VTVQVSNIEAIRTHIGIDHTAEDALHNLYGRSPDMFAQKTTQDVREINGPDCEFTAKVVRGGLLRICCETCPAPRECFQAVSDDTVKVLRSVEDTHRRAKELTPGIAEQQKVTNAVAYRKAVHALPNPKSIQQLAAERRRAARSVRPDPKYL